MGSVVVSRSSLSVRRASALALAMASATMIPLTAVHAQAAESDAAWDEKANSRDVTELSDISVTEDPLRAISNEPSASSFGFSKPLLETPRTVSFVSVRRADPLPSRRGRRRRGLGRLALLGRVAVLPEPAPPQAPQALPRAGVGRRAGDHQRHRQRGRRRGRLQGRPPARPRARG